jgi:hypothetical protein
MPRPSPDLYARIYDQFTAAISRFDCGKKCAPHNGGEPVCCTTAHAVPIVDKYEWRLLESRTDLWHRYEPTDASGRQIVAELHPDCMAVECKGARHCERDNRSLSCRAFPFFPYITRDDRLIGLAYYWIFEQQCWVISNLGIVDRDFARECIAAYELLFAHDHEEYDSIKEHSAYMRRVFTRRNRIIPLIDRDGGYFAVEPRTHVIRPARLDEFAQHGPYKEETAALPAAAD